jgi:hypothetical protein
VRVPELRPGKAYRVFRIRSEGNRHLADLRFAEFPLTDLVERDWICYVGLPMLVALKVFGSWSELERGTRTGTPRMDRVRSAGGLREIAGPALRVDKGDEADLVGVDDLKPPGVREAIEEKWLSRHRELS